MKIVLAGGGTAGHVNPLLATADVLRDRGAEVLVIGTREGLEADLVPSAGFHMETIAKVPLPRRPSPALLSLPVRLRRTVEQCRDLMEGADVLVGFGGYVSTPAYLAARSAGIPVVIHEQNARPGLANRVGACFAHVVALTFASTPLKSRKGQTVVTGLPLRRAVAELARDRRDPQAAQRRRLHAAQRFDLDPHARTLLVTGGSLGALHINDALTAAASALPEGVQVIHLTGKGKDTAVREAISSEGLEERWRVVDYLTTMEDALALADAAVCRSGAGTVAEMTALGLPCVYVPLPIGNGEQRLNAADHVASGGAILVDDADFDADVVRERVFPLLLSSELDSMRAASTDLGHVDAAAELSDLIVDLAQEEDR